MEPKTKIVRNTACLSCGASVPIYSRASLQAVCPYCRSTLVRKDVVWSNVGKMAMLADDLTPFHIGQRSKYSQTAFTIIGRIQQQYSEGIWNEWLLQLGNNKTAWLGEGSGLFYLTVPSISKEPLPAFNKINLGQQFLLDGKFYTVSNIEKAECIATEGEIPFAIHSGDSAYLVDFAGENGQFATIDYSDEIPKLYTGRVLDISELELTDIDRKAIKNITSAPLRCNSCGDAMMCQNPATQTIVCNSCKKVNEISAGKVIHAYSQAVSLLKPKIPLGAKGLLQANQYEVIGFMSRSGGGDVWDEYLLYNQSIGVRWLICAHGHWTFSKSISKPSYKGSEIFYLGKAFKHFGSYNASVVGVLGEFYWSVRKGETVYCSDYICPPYVLSYEKTDKEIVWSIGTYCSVEDIEKGFDIEFSKPKGVGTNQPSPSILGYISAYIISMFCMVVLSGFLHSHNMQIINIGNLDTSNRVNVTTLVSEPFTLEAKHTAFRVHTITNLNNDWLDFEYRLVNQVTGETRVMNREVAFYSGYDSDGSWSEGSSYDDATLPNVTSGTYILEVEAETDQYVHPDVHVRVEATHGESSTKNLWLMLFVLGLGPLLAGLHKYYFEKKRWDQSDPPWGH